MELIKPFLKNADSVYHIIGDLSKEPFTVFNCLISQIANWEEHFNELVKIFGIYCH